MLVLVQSSAQHGPTQRGAGLHGEELVVEDHGVQGGVTLRPLREAVARGGRSVGFATALLRVRTGTGAAGHRGRAAPQPVKTTIRS